MSPEKWQASAFNKNNSRAHSKSIFCCSGGGKLAKKKVEQKWTCVSVCVCVVCVALCLFSLQRATRNKQTKCFAIQNENQL